MKGAGLHRLEFYEETRAVGGDVPFANRAAGARLVADIRAGRVGAVVVRDLDRLTRDVPLGLQFQALCDEHEVVIHTLSGVLATSSPSDRFATTVRAAAQLEKEQARRSLPYGYYLCTRRKQHGTIPAEGGSSFDRLNTEKLLSELLASSELQSRVHARACEVLRASAEARAIERALGKEAGELRCQLETWSRRHADAEPDSEQEVEAAVKIRELKAKLKELKGKAEPSAQGPVPQSITLEKVASYCHRVHGGHQHEAGGETYRSVHAGYGDLAVLERLAEHLQDVAAELRQFVEEEHTILRKADLSWAGHAAAADQCLRGCRVVGRTHGPLVHQCHSFGEQSECGIDPGGFQRFRSAQRRQNGGQPLRQHRLTCSRGPNPRAT